MNRLTKPLAAICFALAAAAQPAHALTVSSVTGNGNNVDTTFVGAGLAGVDFGFSNSNAASVTFTIEQDDAAAGNVRFNSILSMLAPGAFLRNILLSLDAGTSFSTIGEIATIDGAHPAATGAADDLRIAFDPATTEAYLGNVFGTGLDWIIDLGGLKTSDTFTLTVRAVDEPAGLALVLAALAAAGASRRRRA